MHDLCQKVEFLTIFLFLGEISQKRSLSDIQEAKDEFIPEKWSFKEVQKAEIFQKG